MKQSNKEIRLLLQKIIEKLLEDNKQLSKQAFIGLDGYIDRIIRPVKKQLKNEVQYFETITDFASNCAKAAGKKCSI